MADAEKKGVSRIARMISNSPGIRDDLSHGDSSDDSEFQHALEIVFDPENAHRRKSSLVPNDAPVIARREALQRRASSCIVHKLIDQQRQQQSKFLQWREEPAIQSEYTGPNSTSDGDASVVRSRLLTKRQLADMAMGIRNLAKKLGSLKVKLNIRTVFLLTKIYDPTLIAKSRDVVRWLLSKERDSAYTVWVEHVLEHNETFDAKGLLAEDASFDGRLQYWDSEVTKKRPHSFDIVVTLGGDGTVLYASWLFQQVVPPVLSFALGSLGFLTKFDFEHYQETLTKAFRDGVTINLRLRFEAALMRSQSFPQVSAHRDLVEELIGVERGNDQTHAPGRTYEILNDVVVDRGPNSTMSTIELFGDEEHFTTVQADGICVATPTGSTAYNLAAGGSLCHPENPVILVTAICAHTLSFRPIILPDTMVLRIGVPYHARGSSWASFDGRERVELNPGDYVTVSASRYPFANVLPPGRRSEDWINGISRTLQWNSREKQKALHDWPTEEKDFDVPQDKEGKST